MTKTTTYLFITAAFLLGTCPLFAQQSAVDMSQGYVRYLVTHNWTKKMTSLDYISPQRREKVQYMWGNDSEWRMYAELYYSDSASKYLDSDENPDKDVNTYSWKKDAFFIRRDFSTSQETDLITFLGKNYLINDSLQCPNWTVLNDLKEVAGHICMSASWEDTLKEQEIIAWFAMDIPSSAGPERFCGLPGLILEIDINNGAMIASADKITFSPITAEQLALPTKPKGKSIKETEYQTLYAKHIEDKRKNEDPWFWGVRY